MKVLVTGGAGFIGSHIIEFHLKRGDEVWAIDNLTTGKEANLFKEVRFVQAGLKEASELQEAVEWADRVYHAAASLGMMRVMKHPIETLCNNIHSTEALLNAIATSKRKPPLLLISTSGVYCHAPLEGKYIEESDLIVKSGEYKQECYSLGKIVNEVMALGLSEEHNFHCTIARLFNTIGPRQTGKYGMVAPRFVQQALKGEPITVFGDGEQTRSFCCVYDTVRALDLLMGHPESHGEVFNVGNPKEISILQFAEHVKERTKSSSEIEFIPYEEVYGFKFEDVLQRRPSIDKIQKLTGYAPEWTLDQTIDEIAKFYRARLPHSSS